MAQENIDDARMALELAAEDIETAAIKLNQFCELTGNEHLRRTFVATLEHFIGTGGWLGHEATVESLKDEMDVEQGVADESCGEYRNMELSSEIRRELDKADKFRTTGDGREIW